MSLTPTPLLLAINALALAGLTYLWVDETGQIKSNLWSAPTPLKIEISPHSDLPRINSDPSVVAGVLERPIFAPDRRPAPTSQVAAQPEPAKDMLDEAQLVGLLSGDAGGVLVRAEGKVQHIGIKKMLGAWMLQSVDDRIATFTKDGHNKQLQLEYTRLGQALTTPAAITTEQQAKPVAVPGGVNAENLKRQMAEDDDRNRRVAELRARMEKLNHK